MRKVTYGGATSLDGFLSRADHSVDWLLWCDEVAALTADFWKTVDTVLMGRKTYEAAARNGQASGYPGVVNYVFSRSLGNTPEGVTLVREDAVEVVRRLKAADGRDICLMGGGELAHSLLDAGLVDEIGFNIHPILLGSGIPALHLMACQIDLELRECRTFKNGCVYVTYRIKH